ncbi:serine O-acetyltransferase [Methylobacterium sp. A54F]
MVRETPIPLVPLPASGEPISWAETRAALAADRAHWRRRGGRARLHRGYFAIWLHRVSRYLHERGRGRTARLAWLANTWLTGADLPPLSRIGGGLFLPYPSGTLIAGTVGCDAVFGVQASIGGLCRGPDTDIGAGPGLPRLGDGVVLEPAALVLGAVAVGDGARIGPRCIVVGDVPAGASVAPQPWRVLPGRGQAA